MYTHIQNDFVNYAFIHPLAGLFVATLAPLCFPPFGCSSCTCLFSLFLQTNLVVSNLSYGSESGTGADDSVPDGVAVVAEAVLVDSVRDFFGMCPSGMRSAAALSIGMHKCG